MGKYTTKLLALFIAVLALSLASCGGNSALVPAGPTGNNPQGVDVAGLPAIPFNESGLPGRTASDIAVIPGSAALQIVNSTVVDTTLVMSSTDTAMAWGLYKAEGLQGRKVTSLVIEVNPGTLGTHYAVGVSNFSEGVWDFLQGGTLPEFEVDLSADMSRLTSQLGNLYFVVVATGGAEVTLKQTSVISRALEAGETELPALARELSVSEGLADKIVVQWSAIDGAESYELWRKVDIDGQDATPELLATVPAVESQASYVYEDTAITLETEYKYRVRALNSGGPGESTRYRSGWAGVTPPVGEDPTDQLELKGAIDSISGDSVFVLGTEFAINDSTIWLDNNDTVVTAAAFAAGSSVEILGDTNGQGGWIARKVQMEDPAVDEQTLLGSIDAIDAGSITVMGTVFAILPSTEWLDINKQPALPADFLVGGMVEITGSADGLGGWNAVKVQAEDAGTPEEFSVTGVIDVLSETSIEAGGSAFAITVATLWQDSLGAPALPADFAVGTSVEIHGVSDGLGGWNAALIKLDDNGGGGGGELEKLGAIQAIDATSITVDGTTFATTLSTEWQDHKHDPADPSEFTVGLLVDVTGSPDGSGGWIATRIRMEN